MRVPMKVPRFVLRVCVSPRNQGTGLGRTAADTGRTAAAAAGGPAADPGPGRTAAGSAASPGFGRTAAAAASPGAAADPGFGRAAPIVGGSGPGRLAHALDAAAAGAAGAVAGGAQLP